MLELGSRLGGFEIVSLLGAGGMGEVYLARDHHLEREVALKVLPESMTKDEQRRARFAAEARVLASLNHPGIASIHGFDEGADVPYLVLEFVPGETLSARVARGRIPIDEALAIAGQIASALEAAHARGIVHRDLKCANIKLTPERTVKLLDFGLAKVFAENGSSGDEQDTTPQGLTAEGAVLGTVAYMSPEQARGQAVDTRTDVWSFGCVLYEMLAGKPAFRGETPSDTLFAVLSREPDWSTLPVRTPAAVRRVLRRCLERDKSRRLHHVADARLELEDAASPSSLRSISRRSVAYLLLAALVIVSAVALWPRARRQAVGVRPHPRLQIALPPGLQQSDLMSGQTTLALSPDGSRLVFAAGASGSRRLYDRPLDQLEARVIPGSEGANNPFFSPDGQWLGFDADGSLKTIHIQGGEPATICPAPTLRGASWGADGTILFARSAWGGLSRVSALGGTPKPVTQAESGAGESSHRWPQILPGGGAAVFSVMTRGGREEDRTIEAVSLQDGRRRVLVKGATSPHYVATGHLLYARAGSVYAAPFDADRLEITSPARVVLEDVLVWSKTSGAAYFDVSPTGTLAYRPGPEIHNRRLVWLDRSGRLEPIAAPERPYTDPALSPDGKRLAVTIEGPSDDVYVYSLERNTRTRVTFTGNSRAPAWSPDGKRVVFTSATSGPRNLFWVSSDGSGSAEQLTRSSNWQHFVAFAPDGKSLVFTEQNGETASDIWMLPLEGERTPRPIVATPAIELFPAVSPDGRWLAYTSTESRREEVYVQPFPGGGRKWAISKDGGSQPVWSANGRELFYRSGSKMMVVPLAAGSEFRPGDARVLFTIPFDAGGVYATYSVSGDGQRFVMPETPGAETAPPQIVVVLDWFSELQSKLR